VDAYLNALAEGFVFCFCPGDSDTAAAMCWDRDTEKDIMQRVFDRHLKLTVSFTTAESTVVEPSRVMILDEH
jgi:hypothetical protein